MRKPEETAAGTAIFNALYESEIRTTADGYFITNISCERLATLLTKRLMKLGYINRYGVASPRAQRRSGSK